MAATIDDSDDAAIRFQIERKRTPVQVGETRAEIVVHSTGAPGLTYVNMHDDENTAVAATLGTLRRRGGRLIEVRHTGARNLRFELEGAVYAFDPNRVFTEAGAEASLREQGQGAFSEKAFEATRHFAACLLDAVDPQGARGGSGLLVTVHNNKPGPYSVRSYDRGGEHEHEAKRVRLARDETPPDDFFFVTESRHYRLLKGGPFHVVLQDNDAASDDGSLSVWAAREGVPYVNVEAQHGHLRQQIDMLDFLNERLGNAHWDCAPRP